MILRKFYIEIPTFIVILVQLTSIYNVIIYVTIYFEDFFLLYTGLSHCIA